MSNSTNSFINNLKNAGQDFEWYPTTQEIIDVISEDIGTLYIDNYLHKTDITIDRRYYEINIGSFLDIGAGDGRMFELPNVGRKIKIDEKFGIELSTIHGNNLIKDGVKLLGRDYFETTLIEHKFDITFSNPPYSVYKEWTKKILQEINSYIIYLVIPIRWKNDNILKTMIDEKGDVEILGTFNFSGGDRPARAKVDVIKITRNNSESDTFNEWIEDNIGSFEVNEEPEFLNDGEKEKENKLESRNSDDNIKILLENYKEEMSELMNTYTSLAKIDMKLLEHLGMNKKSVIKTIKKDIKELKNKYWKKTFNTLKAINRRLTFKKRKEILEEITWFQKLDFNANNIYTIIIWVVENFNKMRKEQMVQVFKDLTNLENVKAYKSNEKWLDANWRYTKPVPTKYSLDYRIIQNLGHQILDLWNEKIDESKIDNNTIMDLTIVAESLGFLNNGIDSIDYGKHNCYDVDGKVLFEYKIHKNKNVHFKLNQRFLKILNIEVGKLNGWLKKPTDIMSEFDVSEKQAKKLFNNTSLNLMTENDEILMLTE